MRLNEEKKGNLAAIYYTRTHLFFLSLLTLKTTKNWYDSHHYTMFNASNKKLCQGPHLYQTLRGEKQQQQTLCWHYTLSHHFSGRLTGKEIDNYFSDCKVTDRLNLCSADRSMQRSCFSLVSCKDACQRWVRVPNINLGSGSHFISYNFLVWQIEVVVCWVESKILLHCQMQKNLNKNGLYNKYLHQNEKASEKQ